MRAAVGFVCCCRLRLTLRARAHPPTTTTARNQQPGYLRPLLPASAPSQPEPWAAIKRDFYDKILTGVVDAGCVCVCLGV
jgi:hypothetical protein